MTVTEQQIALSGIRPTGDLHLGNLFGAIRYFVELQSTHYQCLYFVADLHALTTALEDDLNIDAASIDVVRWYLACGINPERSLIYRQSDITEIPYLALLLGMMTPEGELRRCTTYKDKVKDLEGKSRVISIGLLSYPVLMAADILFCNANIVPVGEDQMQHLEIAREIARKYNSHFSNKHRFVEPQPHRLEAVKILSLSGEGKMSKSVGGTDGVIFLRDSADEIRRKIKSAVTDSGPVPGEPMTSTTQGLYSLLEHCAPPELYKHYIDLHSSGTQRFYGRLKSDLAKSIAQVLIPIQDRYSSALCSQERAEEYLASSAMRVRSIAAKNLKNILDDMGFSNLAKTYK